MYNLLKIKCINMLKSVAEIEDIMAYVYVVEDDKNISEIESFALKNAGHTVVECASGKEFHKLMRDRIPDMILLDVMLPDEDGLEILRKKGLDLGADDYITKPFGIMELISRVKALLRRTGSSDEEKLIGIGSLFIDDEKRVAYVDDKPVELTYKEYELLKYLALNRGIVLTRDNIMDRIWSTDYEGESRTLDVHIKTLRHKLGAAGNYIKTVRNVGYFMDDEAK